MSYSFTNQIFFPRSIEGEIAARDAAKERKVLRKGTSTESQVHISSNHANDSYLLTSSPTKREYALSSEGPEVDTREWIEEDRDTCEMSLPPLRPIRRQDVELGNQRLTENNLSKHTVRAGNVNPMVTNYISPIGQSFWFVCYICF